MNRNHRLVFNRAQGVMQAAPETAKGRGKSGSARKRATIFMATQALAFTSGAVSAAEWAVDEGNWSAAAN